MPIDFLVYFLVAAVMVLYGIGLFNRLVYMAQQRKNAFADIDVQLKQRQDLVPQLVETVKGYATHEQSVLQNVTAARAAAAQTSGASDAKMQAEQKLSGALMNLFVVAENYPALKADANFQQLMSELSDIENKIAAARRFFNNVTGEYNTRVEQFPSSIIAKLCKFKVESFYEDTTTDRATLEKAPSVKF